MEFKQTNSKLKKGNSIILCLMLLLFSSGCSHEKEVNNIIDEINTIGSVEYTTEFKELIEEVLLKYNSLSKKQQKKVENHDVLVKKIDEYKKLENEVLDIEEQIAKIDLDNVDRSSFKQLTLIKQDYNKLSDFQKKCVENYDIFEQAEIKYQKAKDELTNAIKKWATVDYMQTNEDIKINSQKIVKRTSKTDNNTKNEEYYYVINLTNTNNKAKTDFKLALKTYDETWTISNYLHSDKVDLTPGQTRTFELKINQNEVDAVTISYYEEVIEGEKESFDFGEQEVIQLTE